MGFGEKLAGLIPAEVHPKIHWLHEDQTISNRSYFRLTPGPCYNGR